MSISLVFTFAPIPLTNEFSPLAHAAALARRRQAENQIVATPRHRISPPVKKETDEKNVTQEKSNEPALV